MFLAYNPVRGWDETVYLNLGHQLSITPMDYSLSHSGWSDFIPSSDMVYGWPNIGFRAPLLPYILALLYRLRLDSLIDFLMPAVGALSVFFLYVLGKNMFNKKVGLCSAVLLSIIPIHVLYSSQVLTDAFATFFIIVTFISFWQGYEVGERKHKLLFGLFFALALLARYTTLWIAPVFLIYFIIRDRSFKFIKDKYLWFSILIFFVVLSPLFFYSLHTYSNALGAFIHGFKASTYWGGVQSATFFIENAWSIVSIVGLLFMFSIGYMVFRKDFLNRNTYLSIIWFCVFFILASSVPHKEERFILPLIPAVCLLSGYVMTKISGQFNAVFVIFLCLLTISQIKTHYTNLQNTCFLQASDFLSASTSRDSVVVTNQSPISYYYTSRANVALKFNDDAEYFGYLSNSAYKNHSIYILFTNLDMDKDSEIKKYLDNNFNKSFECSKNWSYSTVYKYR
ncbi:MAG: glycosyltransferase family 39 protein [bacterium]